MSPSPSISCALRHVSLSDGTGGAGNVLSAACAFAWHSAAARVAISSSFTTLKLRSSARMVVQEVLMGDWQNTQ